MCMSRICTVSCKFKSGLTCNTICSYHTYYFIVGFKQALLSTFHSLGIPNKITTRTEYAQDILHVLVDCFFWTPSWVAAAKVYYSGYVLSTLEERDQPLAIRTLTLSHYFTIWTWNPTEKAKVPAVGVKLDSMDDRIFGKTECHTLAATLALYTMCFITVTLHCLV